MDTPTSPAKTLDESILSTISATDTSMQMDGFLASIPGSYQMQQKQKKLLKKKARQSNASEASTLATSNISYSSLFTSDDDELTLAKFHKLAETARVKMAPELMKHICTLLRLGVPSDEVYNFLGQCINNNGEESYLPQQKKSGQPKVERNCKPALIEFKEEITDE